MEWRRSLLNRSQPVANWTIRQEKPSPGPYLTVVLLFALPVTPVSGSKTPPIARLIARTFRVWSTELVYCVGLSSPSIN